MKADLHVHSTASDGTLTAPELVSAALAAQLDVLAIADHDSVAAVPEALSVAQDTSLTVVPAVELSAVHGELDVHVLAYFVDPDSEPLHAMLSQLREARLARAHDIVESLRSDGIPVDFETVLALSDGGATGRSHIARAIVSAGHAQTTSEAFDRFIGRGRPHYLPKRAASPTEVIVALRELGALTVVAHPGVTGVGHLLPEFVDVGLSGIEAYHADHTPAQREQFAEMASQLGVLATGGSDYHGPHAPNPPMGSIHIPDTAIEAFLEADPR